MKFGGSYVISWFVRCSADLLEMLPDIRSRVLSDSSNHSSLGVGSTERRRRHHWRIESLRDAELQKHLLRSHAEQLHRPRCSRQQSKYGKGKLEKSVKNVDDPTYVGQRHINANCRKERFVNRQRTACYADGHLDSHESTRQRVESSVPAIHEDHIAGKGFTSMTITIWVHKFIPMPQAMKTPEATGAVDKEWKKLETIQAWPVEKKRRLFSKHKETKRKSTSPH